ncbi:hypothetical protein HMPREF1584_00157 [Gardnerella vaginalis JCP8481A]|nr:hypothetical protein HMPREF1584_00157 [Gardnerella vaginalis JCP8481A]
MISALMQCINRIENIYVTRIIDSNYLFLIMKVMRNDSAR